MALPAWPSCLPLPQIDGYSVAMSDAVNARDADGLVVARNRFTRMAEAVDVVLVMNGIQLGIWEGWFKHRIANGAGWFTLTLDGEAMTTYTARIGDGYQAELVDTAWRVSFSLLVDAPAEGG